MKSHLFFFYTIADLHLAVTHFFCVRFIQHVIDDVSDSVGYCLRYFSPFDAVRSHLCHAQCVRSVPDALAHLWRTWIRKDTSSHIEAGCGKRGQSRSLLSLWRVFFRGNLFMTGGNLCATCFFITAAIHITAVTFTNTPRVVEYRSFVSGNTTMEVNLKSPHHHIAILSSTRPPVLRLKTVKLHLV